MKRLFVITNRTKSSETVTTVYGTLLDAKSIQQIATEAGVRTTYRNLKQKVPRTIMLPIEAAKASESYRQ